MKLDEIVVASGNKQPLPPVAPNEKRKAEVDDKFDMLDGTNPSKPYTFTQIMAAMKELHARIERQAAHYGGEVDQKTGKIDRSKHKYYDAQIAPNE